MALWHHEEGRFDIGPRWLWIEVDHRGWRCWSVSIHALLLNLDLLTGCYCGHRFRVSLMKRGWGIYATLANGWYLACSLGLTEYDLAMWGMHRILKKMNPEDSAERILATIDALKKLKPER